MINLILLALAASPAAGLLHDGNQARTLVGGDYCVWGSNTTCYASGWPSCCGEENATAACPVDQPACEIAEPVLPVITSTSSTYNPVELPVTAFPLLTLPEGGLRGCNEVIPSDYPDDIIPKEVVLGLLVGLTSLMGLGDLAAQMQSMVQYDVRARKVCTSCEDMNKLWEANNEDEELFTSKTSASEAMPYCAEGSFAYGRTMSGLLLEPIDSVTKEPIVGKVGATISNYASRTNPFRAPSQTWPSNVATSFPREFNSLAAASAGTYTLIPDLLGNGEDWQGVRSYMVKTLYQASAVPLLLKVKDDLEKNYSCTNLDKRVAIMGYSEGGYATLAIAQAIDMLDDDYVHTYTGVGGAPIKWSTEQMYAFVQMHEGTYPFPPFAARLGNAYSSTNGDLANTNLSDTDIQQNFASDEFLDSDDGTKDVREWSKAGLSYTEMFPYMPSPPTDKFTDILNPNFVEMVVSSYNAGNHDPCNSEFNTDNVDKLCEAIIENDMSDFLENVEYPVVICHSPEDQLIYFSNVPNTTTSDNLVMIEDLPGMVGVLKPSGNHTTAAVQCMIGFLFPFMAPPETSTVRNIFPIEDSDGTCYGKEAITSSTSPSVDGATTIVPTTPESGAEGTSSSPTESKETTTTSSTMENASGGSSTVATTDSVTTIPLIGSSWVATEFFDGNSMVQVIPDSTITLSVEDGELSGIAGCNSYFMSVENMTTSSFQIGPAGITEMYCEDQDLMSQETLYMQNFRGGTIGYNILDDGSLELLDGESNIIARYVPTTSSSGSSVVGSNTTVSTDSVTTIPLVGSSWVATDFFDGNSMVQVIPGSTITLSFEIGKLSGNAGCNSYLGTVENMTTSSFQIGPISVTKMLCMDQDLNLQESLYLQNLSGTIEYNILDDGSLELLDGESNIIAHYVPQTTTPESLTENSSPAFIVSTLSMVATGICVLMNVW